MAEALNEIVKFNKIVEDIKNRYTKDETIRKYYKKIQGIREKVSKAFPNGVNVKEGENEVAVATELLKKRQAEVKERKEALEEWQRYDYRKLSHYCISPKDFLEMGRLKSALIPIVFCHDTFNSKKYSNLIQLLTLLTFRKDCASCCSDFEENYSIVFWEKFDDLCWALRYNNGTDVAFCKNIFETLSNEYGMGEEGDFIVFSSNDEKSLGVVILKEEFLRNLLNILDEHGDFDLFDLIDYLYDFYGKPEISEYYQDIIKKLVRLYRETPEQILITEQRYYQEKQLEQLQENARLEREMMEEQAELDRREQAIKKNRIEDKLSEIEFHGNVRNANICAKWMQIDKMQKIKLEKKNANKNGLKLMQATNKVWKIQVNAVSKCTVVGNVLIMGMDVTAV